MLIAISPDGGNPVDVPLQAEGARLRASGARLEDLSRPPVPIRAVDHRLAVGREACIPHRPAPKRQPLERWRFACPRRAAEQEDAHPGDEQREGQREDSAKEPAPLRFCLEHLPGHEASERWSRMPARSLARSFVAA